MRIVARRHGAKRKLSSASVWETDMRFGIDLGGTKIEIVALDDDGRAVLRERVPTPRNDYRTCVTAMRDLVLSAESKLGLTGSVGVAIPGTISPKTGLVKNANSTALIG